MTGELMPRLAQLTKIHGIGLDGKDLVIQCATGALEGADIRMPVVEALRLREFVSKLPNFSSSNRSNGFSSTDEVMPQLARLTKVHGIVLEGDELVIQCATDTLEWADIALPVEEGLKLHEAIWTLMNSFSPKKDGDHVIRFPRPVNFKSILEIQRFRYRANRYMQALSIEELQQRTHDVMANVIRLRDDGKYELIVPKRNGLHAPTRNIDFMRLYLEVGEEMLIRGLLGSGEKSANPVKKIRRLDDESWCHRPDWVGASQHSRQSYSNIPTMLFKFGNAEHMRALHKRGEAFVSPASSFKVADGDAARQDDELSMHWYRSGEKVEFRASDYYCWCCASVYDYRLFWDFESGGKPADACLAIHNLDSFIERFVAAVCAIPNRNAKQVYLRPVLYYDPLAVPDDPTEFAAYQDEAIQCAKHFRFAYQWEFRVVIVPSDPSSLKAFKLEIGSLKDIAELIVAPS